MAFIGERAFLERQLDAIWEEIEELAVQHGTVDLDTLAETNERYRKLEEDYLYYFQRLQQCEIPWWKS